MSPKEIFFVCSFADFYPFSLQIKIKTMQGEFISSQTNMDCELSRLEKEVRCYFAIFPKQDFGS